MFAPWYHALQQFFSLSKHADARVPVVFATPDRAHEELVRVTQRRLQGKGRPTKRIALEDRPAHVPFMALWMSRPKFYAEMFNPGRVVVEKDVQTGTAKVMRWPRPMEAQVTVDLFCGSDGGDLIAQGVSAQIDLQFVAESVFLPVNWADPRWYLPPFNILEHAKVLGPTRIRLIGEGWDDNSALEFGEDQKETRLSWSGRVLGYIPYMPQEARLVREVRFELYDATDEENPELLETLTTGSED